jgi:Ca-activated chloride channel family protein
MPGQDVDPQQLAQLQQIQEQFGKAAKLVGEGATEMESAEKNLAFEEPIVDQARKHQDQALERLAEALALLQPPQPDDQNQQNQDQQQQDQQQQGEDNQEQQEKSEMGTDPARLLQAIRDREAQRSRERERRLRTEREPVEKDW